MQCVTFMTFLVAIQPSCCVCAVSGLEQRCPEATQLSPDVSSAHLDPLPPSPSLHPHEATGVCAVLTLHRTVPTDEIDLFILLKWKSIKGNI